MVNNMGSASTANFPGMGGMANGQQGSTGPSFWQSRPVTSYTGNQNCPVQQQQESRMAEKIVSELQVSIFFKLQPMTESAMIMNKNIIFHNSGLDFVQTGSHKVP